MPWRESCAMDERMRFIVERRSDEWTMTELCERYEISRKTGYKWLERYRLEGPAGMVERSRAPASHGRATPEHLAQAIVGLRRERPTWGPRKVIGKLLQRQPEAGWPSPRPLPARIPEPSYPAEAAVRNAAGVSRPDEGKPQRLSSGAHSPFGTTSPHPA